MKFLDLFAGIGGFRLGMEQAGHNCIGFVEWDKFARKSYEAIHNTRGEWTWHDVSTIDYRVIPRADCWTFGFPCQDISVAGKQKGFRGNRSSLFFEVTKRLQQIKEWSSERLPTYLFIENVKNFLSVNNGWDFLAAQIELDKIGYDVQWQVLNSKHFGVPQNRERLFIIGHPRGAGGREVFPIERANQETNIPVKVVAHRDGYRRNTQTFDSEGITEALDTAQGGGRGHHVAIPVITPERLNKRQNGRRFKEVDAPMFTLTAQNRHGIMLTRNEMKSLRELSHSLMARDYKGIGNQEMTGILVKEATKKGYDIAHPGDSINYSVPISETRRGRVGEGIANTLDTNCQQAVLTDKFRIRKLTPRECFRLQGFPDWAYDKAAAVNSDSQLYKQAGNSVTVNVIYEIAKKLTLK